MPARPQDYGPLIDMAWAQERNAPSGSRKLGGSAAVGWKEIQVRDAEMEIWRTRMEWLQDTRETIKTVPRTGWSHRREVGWIGAIVVTP